MDVKHRSYVRTGRNSRRPFSSATGGSTSDATYRKTCTRLTPASTNDPRSILLDLIGSLRKKF
ncbi:unnamed protein product [Nesidiocoris tenuis]|uniref:Uncharacterized protein n=1 Tax=Nesidiocoris tenuis TaxID=355587 RepID=A0A6H5GTS9_9HEMI|nr:unnamed protein product [Nesidiocoris tenuis]